MTTTFDPTQHPRATDGQFRTAARGESGVELGSAAFAYETRNDAIRSEIVEAIEANGTDVASAADYDVEAIADKVIGHDGAGYHLAVDGDDFWRVVAEHAR